MFWPSFNSVLVDDRTPGRKLGAVLSTYLALAVSAVTAAAVSVLSSPKGKLNLVEFETHCITLSSRRKNNETLLVGVNRMRPSRTELCLCIRLVYFLSGSHAVMHPCWRCCGWGFHVSSSSAMGSDDNWIHCCCSVNHWIPISQGLSPLKHPVFEI